MKNLFLTLTNLKERGLISQKGTWDYTQVCSMLSKSTVEHNDLEQVLLIPALLIPVLYYLPHSQRSIKPMHRHLGHRSEKRSA